MALDAAPEHGVYAVIVPTPGPPQRAAQSCKQLHTDP
jgi:hypothetical protein